MPELGSGDSKRMGPLGWSLPLGRFLHRVVGFLLLVLALRCGGHGGGSSAPPPAPVPPPLIVRFEAANPEVIYGEKATLVVDYSGGTGVLDQGVGPVTSGATLSVGPLLSDTSFTLTVTNSAQVSTTATVMVKVAMVPPVITEFTTAPPVVDQGQEFVLGWKVRGGTSLAINQGIGDVTGTSQISLRTNDLGAKSYTLVASNPFGSTIATTSVQVVIAANIVSFTSIPGVVSPNGTAVLVPAFDGPSGSIDQGIGPVLSGGSYPIGPLTADTVYTLTVTNEAGDQVSRALKVFVEPGVFSPLASTLSNPDVRRTMLLPDGKVLLLAAEAKAELFDPDTDSFSPLDGFITTDAGCLLPDGRVLLIGGYGSSGGPLAEIWDPTSQNHQPLSLPAAFSSATLMTDGKVLLAGEYGGFQARLFDPATLSFQPTAMAQIFATGGTATLLANGKVLLTNATSLSETYDPFLGLFKPTGPFYLNEGTSSYYSVRNASVLLASGPSSGNVLFVGGSHPRNFIEVVGRTGLYDPQADVYHVGSYLLTPRDWAAVVGLASGHVLVAGGCSGGLDINPYYLASAEIRDPVSGAFRPTGAMSTPRFSPVGCQLRDGRVLVAGGRDRVRKLLTAEIYSPGRGVVPVLPDSSLTAPNNVLAGSSGLTCSVPETPGATYFWQVSGGTVTGGLGTPVLTVTAGPTGALTIHCLVVSSAGIPAHGMAQVPIL